MQRRKKEPANGKRSERVVFGQSSPEKVSKSKRSKMNYNEYLKSQARLQKDEKVVQINLANLVDPTVLRALGYFDNEDQVDNYSIDGRVVVPLRIKFKTGALLKEEDITFRKHGEKG